MIEQHKAAEVLKTLEEDMSFISNENGDTLLHVAVKEGPDFSNVILQLLANGANAFAKNNAGKTPLDNAKKLFNDTYFFAWLKQRFNNPSAILKDKNGRVIVKLSGNSKDLD